VAQYILLYEMSGNVDNLWQVVNSDYNRANVTIQLKNDNSKTLAQVLETIQPFVADFDKQGVSIHYAGSGYKSFVFADLILEGQIKSLLMSFVIIIVLLTILFRNFFAGFIGVIPISLTAILGFGIMGWLNISLSTTTALLSSIAIGIGIDFAVHFMERHRLTSQKNYSEHHVMIHTMQHSGRALLFNALIIILGFSVLLFSAFPPNQILGALVSFNMLTCFTSTIILLSIILFKKNIWKKTPESRKNNPD